MADMLEALRKANLVTEAQTASAAAARSANAVRMMREGQSSSLRAATPNLARLETCTSVRQFRHMAMELLVEDPGQIGDVLRLAHTLEENDGRKRLIWQLFSVRDALSTLPGAAERERFIRKALRKAGGLGSK